MTTPQTQIRNENGTWILVFEAPGARQQEFTCATEGMARQLETVLLRTARPAGRARPNGGRGA